MDGGRRAENPGNDGRLHRYFQGLWNVMLELRSADRSKTIYRMFRKENNQCMGLAREYGGGAWRFDDYPSIVINSSTGSEYSVDMEDCGSERESVCRMINK
jgi:hypothetical protein